VDCGGSNCPTCALGKICAVAGDCQSGLCTGGTCHDPCLDGVKGGAETDVDCGGGTCPKCGGGKICSVASDCVSGVCNAGTCAAPVGIEYGKSASKTGCAAGNNTVNHVMDWGTGNNRVVVVGLIWRAGAGSETPTVSYNGVSMTPLTSTTAGSGYYLKMFYALDASLPATAGTYSVNVFGPGGQVYGCVADVSSFRNVVQSAPGSSFVDLGAPNPVGTRTANLTTGTASSWAYDFLGTVQGSTTAAGAGQTTTLLNVSSSELRGSASYKNCGSANPCTMSWTFGQNNSSGWMGAVLVPSS
jgi:hypothetical protein